MNLPEEYEAYSDHGEDRPFAPIEDDRTEDIAETLKAPDAEKPRRLNTISAASFEGRDKPFRTFIVPGADLFAHRNVHGLYGDGGTGKSLIALQLAIAYQANASWLGYMPRNDDGRPVLYFSAEDDKEETHIRVADIVAGSEVDYSDIQGLHIAVMAGQDAVLAIEDAKGARMQRTPLFARLEETIRQDRPGLVILDNLADVFAGNENSKHLARQFIGMLRGLAVQFDTTIIIIAHPSLSGISSGTGSSGNSAWNNSVRSRLYLKRQHDDAKEITDPDFRRLVTMKSNYTGTGGEIGMRWEAGRFVPTEAASASVSGLDRMAAASKAQRVFLHLVRLFNDQRRNISPSPSAAYAPLLFSRHPESEGVTKRQFEIALDTLMSSGSIIVTEEGAPSKRRKNIIVKQEEPEID